MLACDDVKNIIAIVSCTIFRQSGYALIKSHVHYTAVCFELQLNFTFVVYFSPVFLLVIVCLHLSDLPQVLEYPRLLYTS